MARTYHLGFARRLVNALIGPLTRLGLGGTNTYRLTVRGRKTGQPHSTPVTIVELDGHRYLVAPYGEVSWVKNARAAGDVDLSRKGRTQRCSVRELDPADRVPVLRTYLRDVAVVRPYFDVKPDSPDEDFLQVAPHKPVFEVTSTG